MVLSPSSRGFESFINIKNVLICLYCMQKQT
jgi:hypothetical protein